MFTCTVYNMYITIISMRDLEYLNDILQSSSSMLWKIHALLSKNHGILMSGNPLWKKQSATCDVKFPSQLGQMISCGCVHTHLLVIQKSGMNRYVPSIFKKSVRIWRNPQYKDTHARHKYGLQDISLVPQHVQNLMFDVHGPDPPRSHTMLKDGASQCNNFFATLLCWNCNWRKSQVSY